MDKKYMQEKLAFEKMLRTRNDFILKAFIVIFIVGYSFFFLSNFFFPKVYKYTDITYVGETIDLEDFALTLDTWDYSKSDKAFELIFDEEKLTLEDEEYIITCRNGDKVYKSEVYKNSDGLLVIRTKGVPRRWAEVVMTISIGTKSANLHMSDKSVHEVDELKNRTEEQYKIYSIERKIYGMKNSIKDIKKQVKERDKKMQEAYAKLDNLEHKKEYQTEEQQLTTEEQKSKISSDYENLRAEQDEAMLQIDELTKTIEIQKKLYDELIR